MKITAVTATPISVPAGHPQALKRTALGPQGAFDYAVIEVATDEGITGLGEISSVWGGQGHYLAEFVANEAPAALEASDPLALLRGLDRIRTRFDRYEPAYAAIEMALLDIAGQAYGTPVYNLLGGRMRESIVLSRSVGMGTPDEMAHAARRAVDEGFECVKVKVGSKFEDDLAGVAAVRAAIGSDVVLRIDANMGWSTAKEAIHHIKRFEAYNIHSVEEPIKPGNLTALREIRRSVDTPIMLDESVWTAKDAWAILQASAADMLNVYVAESGGIRGGQLIFELGQLANVDCVVGAMPELGIGTAAAVHLAVAVEELRHPCDACGVIYHDVDIVTESFHIENGRIWPPEGPGLGVTLDSDTLDRFRVTKPPSTLSQTGGSK